MENLDRSLDSIIKERGDGGRGGGGKRGGGGGGGREGRQQRSGGGGGAPKQAGEPSVNYLKRGQRLDPSVDTLDIGVCVVACSAPLPCPLAHVAPL